ncbi:MAG TPA: HlyD family secretion protein [Gemmatimonadaceae bacterium]|nr:HlyD family secretion protein [Gemmatimonadaceae bacterium]
MATTMERDVNTEAKGPATSAERLPSNGTTRKRVLLVVGILAAIAGLTWAGRTWYYSHTHVSTDDAQVDGRIIPVLAKVGGYIEAVNVKDNDSVKAGQTLAKIDDSEYKVRLEQAQGDLEYAQAAAGSSKSFGQAQAQVEMATGQQQASEAQIAVARANRDKALSDLARAKELVAKQIVSPQQLDAYQAAADAAVAQMQVIERQTLAARGNVSTAQAGVKLAQARLLAAQAARDNAALQLGYTTVTAPESGTIAKKLIEVGQLVQAGQTLMSVVSDTGTWITANFKETQLADMRVGQPAEISVDAYSGAVVEGEVESLSGATGARFALLPPDNATGNFNKVVQRVPVRIKITKRLGPARPLRPGMSVDVHVKTK